MPRYRYVAFTAAGLEKKGRITAADPAEATTLLKADGLYPSELSPEQTRRFALRRGTTVADFFQNLSVMISAGVMLPDAIRTIASGATGPLREDIEAISIDVVRGHSLSQALEQRGGRFPAFAISMVRASEESGTLDTVLTELSAYMEKERELRDRVTSALVYPAFMTGVSIIVIMFVVLFVFPRVTSIFADQKVAMPLVTRMLIAVSAAVRGYWYLMAGIIAGLAFAARKLYNRRRREFHRLLFDAPVGVFRNLALSRLCRALGLLLSGGVPVLKALDFAKDVAGNDYVTGETIRIMDRVREGRGISEVAEFMPPVYRQIIQTGEKSGTLATSLGKTAAMAERDFIKAVDMFLRVLEPTIILVMGVVVGSIVFSILLPLFQMNQLIR